MLDEDEVEEGEEEGSRRRRRSSILSSSTHSAASSNNSSSRSDSGTLSSSSSSKEGRYRGLVLQLRPMSRELLGHLLRHLRRVVARSEENKMTAENLAVTVGLNLLRKSESVAGRCVGGRREGREGSSCVLHPFDSSHISLLFPFLTPLSQE